MKEEKMEKERKASKAQLVYHKNVLKGKKG
jgi:hypothetical protein